MTTNTIVGGREADQRTGRVSLLPPRDLRLAADGYDGIHAFWYNSVNQLQTAQAREGNGFGESTTLADAAAIYAVAKDASGRLHLVYINAIDTAGIYYRSNAGGAWSAPVEVYRSAYFRTARPDRLHVDVAGNGKGQVVVTWDDPREGQSVYVRSADDGVSWSEPQILQGSQTPLISHAYLAATSDNSFLAIWADETGGGCGYNQRRSTDGGQTWTPAVRILSSPNACADHIEFFTDANGRLWLIGSNAPSDVASDSAIAEASLWNGGSWSDIVDVHMGVFDAATQHTIDLSCVQIAIGGLTAGLIGCDPQNDIWAAQNAVPLDEILPGVTPVWSPLEALSDQAGIAPDETGALAADSEGNLYALWSQLPIANNSGSSLFAAMQTGGRWSRGTPILSSPDASSLSSRLGTAEQPSAIADSQGRLQTVWLGSGEILYSSAYFRDAISSRGWLTPVGLPMPDHALGSWPTIATDPNNRLFVAYAVPFNEKRGIYLVRSDDGGSTWSLPTTVFDAVASGWDSVSKPWLALDAATGMLHITWLQSALPGSNRPQALYYAQSADNGQHWSPPVQVAEGDVDWPRVQVANANQIHLAWVEASSGAQRNATAPLSAWGQYSPDGGRQWSSAGVIPGFDHISGPVSITTDGAGKLYLAAIGQGVSDESTMYYIVWSGTGWGKRESLPLGQVAHSGNTLTLATAPQAGKLGALLHLWTWTEASNGQFEIVATDRPIEVVPVTPAPTFTPAPSLLTPSPTPATEITPTPKPDLTDVLQKPASSTRGPSPMLLGGILAALIIAIFAGRTIWLRRK